MCAYVYIKDCYLPVNTHTCIRREECINICIIRADPINNGYYYSTQIYLKRIVSYETLQSSHKYVICSFICVEFEHCEFLHTSSGWLDSIITWI